MFQPGTTYDAINMTADELELAVDISAHHQHVPNLFRKSIRRARKMTTVMNKRKNMTVSLQILSLIF